LDGRKAVIATIFCGTNPCQALIVQSENVALVAWTRRIWAWYAEVKSEFEKSGEFPLTRFRALA